MHSPLLRGHRAHQVGDEEAWALVLDLSGTLDRRDKNGLGRTEYMYVYRIYTFTVYILYVYIYIYIQLYIHMIPYIYTYIHTWYCNV